MFPEYDVIVVGAGHAGCEAAAAAANMGSRTLLITMNMQTIAQMSCNPAMGGIAKGQIVREIDALGGYSGIVTDLSMIQFRMLNKSKGPAMWSPRAQNDRMLFAAKWREKLEQTPNLDFYQDMVKGLLVKDNRIGGVITGLGHEIRAKAVVLTNGTFLNGIIHIGEKQFGGGRVAEKAASGITEQLVSLGFESNRLKTGTPPRVDGRSLDDFVMKSVVNKSGNKVYIIQQTDKKISLETIAKNKGWKIAELLEEMETIAASGTKLNLGYAIDEMLDEEDQEEILDYFKTCESSSLDLAQQELSDFDFNWEQLKIMRIRFLSEFGM